MTSSARRLQLWFFPIGLPLLLASAWIALNTGPLPTHPLAILKAFAHGPSAPADANLQTLHAVLWQIRLPRLLVAIMVGAGLGAAGACLQGLFRNPLADPGLIGVASGGAVGTFIGILLLGTFSTPLLNTIGIPLFAMSGALASTALVYHTARIAGKTHVSSLLLAGIAINAMASAIVGLLLYVSDNDALRRFTFWTLGSLADATWREALLLLPFVGIPLLLLPRDRLGLNAFLLGEAEAWHLGFNTQAIKRRIIILCAAMVGATVAFCGLIGFVGLVIPHLARLILGPDFRRLLPASMLLGALLLVLADVAARTLNPPSEIPIGILTSLIGAPFFLFLIYQRKRQLSC